MGKREINKMVKQTEFQRFCDKCKKDISDYWGCSICRDEFCDDCKDSKIIILHEMIYCDKCYNIYKDLIDELYELNNRIDEIYDIMEAIKNGNIHR